MWLWPFLGVCWATADATRTAALTTLTSLVVASSYALFLRLCSLQQCDTVVHAVICSLLYTTMRSVVTAVRCYADMAINYLTLMVMASSSLARIWEEDSTIQVPLALFIFL